MLGKIRDEDDGRELPSKYLEPAVDGATKFDISSGCIFSGRNLGWSRIQCNAASEYPDAGAEGLL